MAWQTVRRVFDHSQAGGVALLALVALAEWANADGIVWGHKNDELAARMRCSERTVVRQLNELREAGELYAPTKSRGRGKPTRKLITAGLDRDQLWIALTEGGFDLDYGEIEAAVDTIITTRKGDRIDTFSTQKGDNIDTFKGDRIDTFFTQKGDRIDTHTTYNGNNTYTASENGHLKNARGAPAVLTRLDPSRHLDALILALAETCQLEANLPAHRAQLEQAAAQLAIKYSADDIKKRYLKNGRVDGWNWYASDWRGQKGQAPTLKAVIETIARQAPAVNQQAEMSTAEILAHARAQMAKGIV